jgi:hypothetical protein
MRQKLITVFFNLCEASIDVWYNVPMQGRNHKFFLGEAELMGGHNLSPPLVEMGVTCLKI